MSLICVPCPAMPRYQQSELVHARWAMLGVAGVLTQEIVHPELFWYESGLPQNLPEPFKNVNMGGLLAWEFILMHWVEVLRWQDYKNHGSVNEVRGLSLCQTSMHDLRAGSEQLQLAEF